MADGVTINKAHLRALKKKMKQLGEDVGQFKAVNKEAADMVAEEAQRRAPVQSGAARRSTKGQGSETRARVVAGTTTRAKDYAARQHWSQQDGKAGEEWVYKAVGKLGWDVVDLYYEFVQEIIRRINRSGTRDAF